MWCVYMCVCACVCVCVFDCEINTHWMLGQTSIDKFLHSKADILPSMKPDHTNIDKADWASVHRGTSNRWHLKRAKR